MRVNIADDNDIDYKVDVYNSYSSDEAYYYEETHIEAIENSIKFLINI